MIFRSFLAQFFDWRCPTTCSADGKNQIIEMFFVNRSIYRDKIIWEKWVQREKIVFLKKFYFNEVQISKVLLYYSKKPIQRGFGSEKIFVTMSWKKNLPEAWPTIADLSLVWYQFAMGNEYNDMLSDSIRIPIMIMKLSYVKISCL